MQVRLSLLLLLLASVGAQAERFNYSVEEYTTIRGLQRCVNKAGWDNEQEHNDQILSSLLRQRALTFDEIKLDRDAHWYETRVQKSKLADMEYEIADIEKDCSLNIDLSAVLVQQSAGVSTSIDELLDL